MSEQGASTKLTSGLHETTHSAAESAGAYLQASLMSHMASVLAADNMRLAPLDTIIWMQLEEAVQESWAKEGRPFCQAEEEHQKCLGQMLGPGYAYPAMICAHGEALTTRDTQFRPWVGPTPVKCPT